MRKRSMTVSSAEPVHKFADLFDEPAPMTWEEISAGLREAGYDPDRVGARMKAVAHTALLSAALDMPVRKVKSGLRYAASGQYQDHPEGMLELGVVLDALDMLVVDFRRLIGGGIGAKSR